MFNLLEVYGAHADGAGDDRYWNCGHGTDSLMIASREAETCYLYRCAGLGAGFGFRWRGNALCGLGAPPFDFFQTLPNTLFHALAGGLVIDTVTHVIGQTLHVS